MAFHSEAYINMYLKRLVCVQNGVYVEMYFRGPVFVNNKTMRNVVQRSS